VSKIPAKQAVPDPDPKVRSAVARIGAYALHAKYDPVELTKPARAKAFQRFLDQVDPHYKLPERERVRRALSAQKAHMHLMALKSAQARKARKAQREAGEAVVE
jgi:hypothetical protein